MSKVLGRMPNWKVSGPALVQGTYQRNLVAYVGDCS